MQLVNKLKETLERNIRDAPVFSPDIENSMQIIFFLKFKFFKPHCMYDCGHSSMCKKTDF